MATKQTAPIPAHPPTAEYRHFIWDTRRWNAFRHRPGDIFVCTPPKCGTTWTQTIVAMLLFQDGNLPATVMDMAPWLDARFYPLDEQLARLEAQTHRRSIKTHTSADGVPWWPDAKYIVVGRDGRDTFMSFVNHMASLREDRVLALIESAIAEGIEFEPFPPLEDIHEFFAAWVKGGELFRFLVSYWQLRDQPNVLFVHYNDLKADLEKEVRRIAAFLGIPIDESRLAGILERCSFDWMKTNSDRIGDLDDLFKGGGQSFFFKGTNGRWKDVLTPEELATYEQRSRESMPTELKAWLDRS
jgi:aryl sulfotransferase